MIKSPPLSPDLAWAAYLVSSWWGSPLPAPDVPADPAEVVARLRRNGFPLLTLLPALPAAQAILGAEPFRLAIQQDSDKMQRQQAAFAEIVAAWRNHDIPALFVKAMGPPPSFPYVSNNLDVLVPQARQDEARRVVRELRYVELRHIEEPNKFLFRRFHRGERAFDLHIHGRLEWHTEFVDSSAVWPRAAFAADCDLALVPAPEDGLLIALAHAVYENKAFKLIELAKVIYACRSPHVDWDTVEDGARRRGWLPGLSAALLSLDAWERRLYGTSSLLPEVVARAERQLPAWLRSPIAERFSGAPMAPVGMPFVESKRLFYQKMLADPSHNLPVRLREAWTHTLYGTRVRIHLRSQRPLLIALDGIDGSGKSAQAELLAAALATCDLRHRVVWTRGGSSRLMQPLFALAKRLLKTGGEPAAQDESPDESVAAREARRERLFRHPIVKALWPWAVAFELGPAWLARIGWPLLRGEVVVADRYIVTTLVELAARVDGPGAGASGRLPRLVRSLPVRLLVALSPRPDRAYWFDISPDLAVRRKGDESAGFLQAQTSVAPAIVATCRAVSLDASLPLDTLGDSIVVDVLGPYEDRHRTVLNGLFAANPRLLPADWRRPGLADSGERA